MVEYVPCMKHVDCNECSGNCKTKDVVVKIRSFITKDVVLQYPQYYIFNMKGDFKDSFISDMKSYCYKLIKDNYHNCPEIQEVYKVIIESEEKSFNLFFKTVNKIDFEFRS